MPITEQAISCSLNGYLSTIVPIARPQGHLEISIELRFVARGSRFGGQVVLDGSWAEGILRRN